MKKVLAIAIGLLSTVGAWAQSEPFQASLTPDIAIQPRTQRIEGLTLSVWGENPQKSLALGFVNGSTGDSAGFNWAFVLNYSEDFTGVQWGMANCNKNDFVGWQWAALNYTGGDFKGLQSGWVNYAESLTGLQFGLVNYAKRAESGVQIGLVNLLPQNTEWFSEFPDNVAPGMIFVNWRF